ncbi:MAG: hypothetical protein WCP30_02165 [Mycobacteriaceae bacterium]
MGRKSRKKQSSSEGGAGFAVLIVLWLIIKLIWVIVGALVLVGSFFLVRAIVRESRRRRALYAMQCAEIAARADQQHNWVMQGDDRGTYGEQGARLMREIRAGGEARLPTTRR